MTDSPPRRPRAARAIVPTAEMMVHAPDFDPVPRVPRHDGWTPDRQRALLSGLAETGCVATACARIGMAATGAYQLRLQPGAESFAAAWAQAQSLGVQRLADVAFDRAMNGTPEPVFHRGEQVGERRRYNDRLLMWTLRHHDPETYGGGPVGDRVSPHVRRRLRREWEAERGEDLADAVAHAQAEARATAKQADTAASAERLADLKDYGGPGGRLRRKLHYMHRNLFPVCDCGCMDENPESPEWLAEAIRDAIRAEAIDGEEERAREAFEALGIKWEEPLSRGGPKTL